MISGKGCIYHAFNAVFLVFFLEMAHTFTGITRVNRTAGVKLGKVCVMEERKGEDTAEGVMARLGS